MQCENNKYPNAASPLGPVGPAGKVDHEYKGKYLGDVDLPVLECVKFIYSKAKDRGVVRLKILQQSLGNSANSQLPVLE